jgi:hypothetical protein
MFLRSTFHLMCFCMVTFANEPLCLLVKATSACVMLDDLTSDEDAPFINVMVRDLTIVNSCRTGIEIPAQSHEWGSSQIWFKADAKRQWISVLNVLSIPDNPSSLKTTILRSKGKVVFPAEMVFGVVRKLAMTSVTDGTPNSIRIEMIGAIRGPQQFAVASGVLSCKNNKLVR